MKKFIREQLLRKVIQLELDLYHQACNMPGGEVYEIYYGESATSDVLRERLEDIPTKALWHYLRMDLLRKRSNKIAMKINKAIEEDEEE